MSNIVTEPDTLRQCLQEVALAEGGIRDDHEAEREKRQERFLNDIEMSEMEGGKERKLKTASLKRFFRMNESKKSAVPISDAMVTRGDHNNVDVNVEEQNHTDGDDNNDDEEEPGGSKSKQETLKRFKLRLGAMYRYSDTPDSASKLDLNSAASKVTLKSSFSTYWNSVFKKKKAKSSHEVVEHEHELPPPQNHFSESALQSQQRGDTLAEAVHALKISEEPNGN